MMLRTGTVALLLVICWPGPAQGDPEPDVDAGTRSGGLFAEATKQQDATPTPTSAQSSQSTGPHISIGNHACQGASQVAEPSQNAVFCSGDEEERSLTAEDVRRAFAELALPAGTLSIQPPDGLTLVNFETNFYTTSTAPISTTVTLLGHQVTLEATPARFGWHFGDGETTTTTEPGAPYPDLSITHRYRRTGEYHPRLSTTYTGRYRIGTGPWQTIPGTVTIDGPAHQLRAIEADPQLVGH
jgi:hypothetical protein